MQGYWALYSIVLILGLAVIALLIVDHYSRKKRHSH
jgi:hypothetical protein